jgi:hypothetical protein
VKALRFIRIELSQEACVSALQFADRECVFAENGWLRPVPVPRVGPAGKEAQMKKSNSFGDLKQAFGVGLAVLVIFCGLAARVSAEPRENVVKIVGQIQRADYEGKRAELMRLFEELEPFAKNEELGSRARYWRGFAMWRRAMNGYNDSTERAEIQEDLERAVEEFVESAKQGNGYVEAKIGEFSCVTFLAYGVEMKDAERRNALIGRRSELLKELEAKAAENPRMAWVLGSSLWYTPEQFGGGQENAMVMYEKGLVAARKERTEAADALDPAWGEAELRMNLAWSNLNRKTPDLAAAEKNGQLALEIVPYWHYMKDVLMAQIMEAKKKEKISGGGNGASRLWRENALRLLRA